MYRWNICKSVDYSAGDITWPETYKAISLDVLKLREYLDDEEDFQQKLMNNEWNQVEYLAI